MKLHKVLKHDLLWILIPALVWVSIIKLRPHVTTLTCIEEPEICEPAQVNSVDQVYIHLNDEEAHEISHVTQNTAGILAAVVPLVIHAGRVFVAGVSWPGALAAYGVDLVILLKTVAWNGMFVELARIMTQRPRPHVYDDSHISGLNPSHYTSFYSGHTSFAAAMTVGLFLLLLARGIRKRFAIPIFGLGLVLTLATAVLRVIAGRHFVTDVFVGFVAGAVVAVFVHFFSGVRREVR